MTIVHGKKTSIKDVQVFAENMGGVLLSMNYTNMLCPLEWKCSKGHCFITTFNHVKNRGQWCPVCGQEKSLKNMKERFKNDPSVKEKISKSHLKRLTKQSRFAGKTQREIASRLRDHLTGLLRKPNKHQTVLKYLQCSLESLRSHLESKFEAGMTWDNRGQFGWHIDHIKPLSAFDLTVETEIYKAFHYMNLQPLWAIDNLVKSHKY